jgi:RNA polymerase sigma-70 factor (ECF subfamily)
MDALAAGNQRIVTVCAERGEMVLPEAQAEAAGESNAAEALYREHFDFVWRNARRLGCTDDWVDDATHEVFLIAARRLAEFEGRANVRTWLFSITLRVVQRLRRDRARYAAKIQSYSRAHGTEQADVPQEKTDDAAYLRELLLRLDEDKRAVVILVELEGMTSAEAAQTLELKQGTVDSRLRAARMALTAMIERDRIREERQTR